jgi:hypothetical protein
MAAEQKSHLLSRSPVCQIDRQPKKSFITVTFVTPGPSDYKVNHNVNRTRGPTFTIATKLAPKRDNHSPGPGNYHRDLSSESSNSSRGGHQSFRFGSAKRKDFVDPEKAAIPGPGLYNTDMLKSSFNSKKGFTISQKFIETKPEIPGPGAYRLNCSFVKSASIALTMAKS